MKIELQIPDAEGMIVVYSQVDSNEPACLRIEYQDYGRKDNVNIIMDEETAEQFLNDFRASLDSFKRRKQIKEMTNAACDQNDAALRKLED